MTNMKLSQSIEAIIAVLMTLKDNAEARRMLVEARRFASTIATWSAIPPSAEAINRVGTRVRWLGIEAQRLRSVVP